MSIVNMGFRNKQAFALLKALKQDITGEHVELANIGDYINCFQSIRDLYEDENEFFSAVYNNVRMRVQAISWNVSPAENPYGFIETNQDMIVGLKTEGYVFDRPIDEQDYEQTYFGMHGQDDANYLTVDGDENITAIADEDKLNVLQWRKKDYPTKVLGTYGESHFKDHITYYRHWILDSMTNPYQFYSMYSAIKSAWRENWKQYKAMWSMNTFLNALTTTAMSRGVGYGEDNTNQYIDLLALYNTEFGENLTVDTWKLPENVRKFAPWCYIKINEIVKLFTRKTSLFAPVLTETFRGKDYTWMYACPSNQIATAFIDYPFKLMKSYSNAEVFNEGDLEKPDVHYLAYWQSPLPEERMNVKVGKYLFHDYDGTPVKAQFANGSYLHNILGFIYDKRAIGTSYYGEWEKDTGLNAETGHGNIHIHCTVSNYYNPYRKAVVLTLGNPLVTA